MPREGFDNPQHYGAAGGEQGRDIVARRSGELWYVQCKRVKECGPQVLLDEVEKVHRLAENNPDLRPAGMLFVISCDVSATARDRTAEHCSELGLACEIWGRTDLDPRVQQCPDIVERFFIQQVQPTGVSVQAPPLPPHFVPRPEVSNALIARLLADEPAAPGILVVSAIHGLGGIGKSVLAAALAHDPEIHKRFPDGVIWVVLGQQPELLPRLHECIQALGDYSFLPMTVDGGAAQLRSLLHKRACLLVVDDVWQADDVRPFLVSGPRCVVLITTRDAKLARKVGAHLYNLDVMSEAQALALFEARLGPLDGDREQAAALARRLDHLPLALELAAAQVEAGFSWTELLDSFCRAQTDLAALDLDEAKYRSESLRLSFRPSLEQLSPDDLEAFAWLGVLPEDAHINPAMAATLWNQAKADAHWRLHRFQDKALLRLVDSDLYTIHDLLHDEAKLRLMERMPVLEAHTLLLERYRVQTQDNLWHTLPDDGYIHDHLTWHLGQAGRAYEVHTLLCEQTADGRNGWHEARDRLGQTAGYLDDVARAWNIASCSGEMPLQIRYALIESTIHSLAQGLPTELLIGILQYKSDLMSPAVILGRVRQLPKVWQRADTLHDLALYLPDEILPDALAFALTIARENERGLLGLAPCLPPGLLETALRRLPDSANEGTQFRFLEAVVSTIPDRLMDLALSTAQQIQRDDCCAVALSCLTARLSDDLLGQIVLEALGAASQPCANLSFRAKALMYLAPYISPDQIEVTWKAPRETEYSRFSETDHSICCAWLAQAYCQSGAIDRVFPLLKQIIHLDEYRYEAITAIVPELSEDQLQRMLDYLPLDYRRFEWPKALGILAKYGSAELQHQVLDMARHEERFDDASRLVALASIAPHLRQPETRDQVWGEVSATLHGFSESSRGWNSWQLNAYREIIEHLPTDLVCEVVQESRGTWSWYKVALESLHKLTEPLRKAACEELLSQAKQDNLEWEILISMSTKLTPHVSSVQREELFNIALQRARRIEDENSRDSMAPYRAHISHVWEDRPSHRYFREHDHVRVLLAMIPYSSQMEQAARLALEALCALDSCLVDIALQELIPVWPLFDSDQQALVALRIPKVQDLPSIQDHAARYTVDLIGIWSWLLGHTFGESKKQIVDSILSLAQKTPLRSLRAVLFSLIADELDEPTRQHAEAEIMHWLEENTEGPQPEGYHPSRTLMRRVLDTLRTKEDKDTWREVASSLLETRVFVEALHHLSRIEDHKGRPNILIHVVSIWGQLLAEDAYRIFVEALPLFARIDRKQFLWDLHAIAPIILKIGGEDAIKATVEEVERVMAWWP